MKKLLILGMAFIMSCTSTKQNKIPATQLDLPEEFNTETISHDRAKPTLLMVVYDTTNKKYIFEFMDN
jgi:hypothetical protein